jgi:anti-sigma factor RsiW
MRTRLHRDLVCRQAVQLMTDYLDGALSNPQARRFERHLVGCPHCTEYLNQLRVTIAVSAKIGADPSVDQETRQALIAMYRAWRR